MRRTARALTVATLAGAVVSLAPVVSAEPSAETTPRAAAPGGTLTVTVHCDPDGGPGDSGHGKPGHGKPGHEQPGRGDGHELPDHGTPDHGARGPEASDVVRASSRAFEGGTAELRRVPGDESRGPGVTYRGTARIVTGGESGAGPDGTGRDATRTVDGDCPGAPGGRGGAWSTTFTVSGGGQEPCREPGGDCGHDEHRDDQAAAVPGGVQAGDGGSFGVSVPALVAGGLLIVGAVGAALLRVRNAVRGTGD